LQLSLLSRFGPFIYHAPLQLWGGGLTMKNSNLIPVERIEKAIYLIRGEKVMLDSDLAALYSVTTARFNQQVTRNIERFPEDFMFQLTAEEFKGLILQIATSKRGRRGSQPGRYHSWY